MKYSLKCLGCDSEYGPSYPYQTCGACGGNLEVAYEERPRFLKSHGEEFWDYEALLPYGKYRHSELGGTKLIRSHTPENIYLKLEIENPTRSFKDRGSVVEVAKAKEYGYDTIACASTGNMAYSLCYYADLEGMKARVFISSDANKDKLRNIRKVGDAEIERVNGDFNKALGLAYKFARRSGAFLTGDYCYRKEGQKTVAYEIMDQLPSATHIVVPVGNATLVSAVFRALKEMESTGRIKRCPKIIAVQAERCSPLVKALKSGNKIKYETPKTKADAIAVGYPTFGEEGLRAVIETEGSGITVTEKEMLGGQKAFQREYGLIAELAGVASLIAARKLRLKAGERAVAIISGGNV